MHFLKASSSWRIMLTVIVFCPFHAVAHLPVLRTATICWLRCETTPPVSLPHLLNIVLSLGPAPNYQILAPSNQQRERLMTSKRNLEASATSTDPPKCILCHLEPCQTLTNKLAYFIIHQSPPASLHLRQPILKNRTNEPSVCSSLFPMISAGNTNIDQLSNFPWSTPQLGNILPAICHFFSVRFLTRQRKLIVFLHIN